MFQVVSRSKSHTMLLMDNRILSILHSALADSITRHEGRYVMADYRAMAERVKSILPAGEPTTMLELSRAFAEDHSLLQTVERGG